MQMERILQRRIFKKAFTKLSRIILVLVKTFGKGLKPAKPFKHGKNPTPKSIKLFIPLKMSTCLDPVLDQGLDALPTAKCVLLL